MNGCGNGDDEQNTSSQLESENNDDGSNRTPNYKHDEAVWIFDPHEKKVFPRKTLTNSDVNSCVRQKGECF